MDRCLPDVAESLGLEVVISYEVDDENRDRSLNEMLRLAKMGEFGTILAWSLVALDFNPHDIPRRGRFDPLALLERLDRYRTRLLCVTDPWTGLDPDLRSFIDDVDVVLAVEARRLGE